VDCWAPYGVWQFCVRLARRGVLCLLRLFLFYGGKGLVSLG